MTLEDIVATLKYENMINILDTPPRETPVPDRSYVRRKRGGVRGRSLVNRRPRPNSSTPAESEEKDKVVIPTQYEITWDQEYIEAILRKHESRGYLSLRPERLKYHPFLVSRNPQKPPGALARATLMANNPNQQRQLASGTGHPALASGHIRDDQEAGNDAGVLGTPQKIVCG